MSLHRVFAEAISIAQYTSLRENWATVPLDRQKQKTIPGHTNGQPRHKYRRKTA